MTDDLGLVPVEVTIKPLDFGTSWDPASKSGDFSVMTVFAKSDDGQLIILASGVVTDVVIETTPLPTCYECSHCKSASLGCGDSIEVETIHEMNGDEVGGTMGYYSRGHHTAAEFIAEVNEEWDQDYSELDVSWGWFRNIPITATSWEFDCCKAGDEGAYPITSVGW